VAGNTPLRYYKATTYEGGIRVPLIARWPGQIQAGATSDHVCVAWDLLPTICEATGIKPPQDIDGISLMPVLSGQGTQRDHEYLYWEFPGYGGQQALRMGHWKAVRTNMAQGNRKLQLFDLSKDIGEQHDVSAEHPQRVQQMLQLMKAARTPATMDAWNRYLEDGANGDRP
jgi:arylsulfatase